MHRHDIGRNLIRLDDPGLTKLSLKREEVRCIPLRALQTGAQQLLESIGIIPGDVDLAFHGSTSCLSRPQKGPGESERQCSLPGNYSQGR